MLGVRLYKKIQIDLWCGEAGDFFAEKKFQLSSATLESNLRECLLNAVAKEHIALICSADFKDFSSLMLALKSSIDSESFLLRRVTLITSSLEEYKVLQKQLFTVFPDNL